MEETPTHNILAHDEFLGVARIKNLAGSFSLGHWIVDKYRNEVEPHGHEDAHFMFVTGGQYVSKATGESASGRPQMVYNPPHTFHRDHFESSAGSFFTISVSAEFVSEASEVSLPKVPIQINHITGQGIVSKLMQECVQWQPDSVPLVEALCLEMMGTIASPSIDRSEPRWLKTAYAMLQDSYTEEVTIHALSRAVGVHPIHLTRTFRAFYRCTPGEFLRIRRVQKAAELLISTHLPLVEVALKSGFADQSHLTKHFRRAYGIPPGEYRRLTARHNVRR